MLSLFIFLLFAVIQVLENSLYCSTNHLKLKYWKSALARFLKVVKAYFSLTSLVGDFNFNVRLYAFSWTSSAFVYKLPQSSSVSPILLIFNVSLSYHFFCCSCSPLVPRPARDVDMEQPQASTLTLGPTTPAPSKPRGSSASRGPAARKATHSSSLYPVGNGEVEQPHFFTAALRQGPDISW